MLILLIMTYITYRQLGATELYPGKINLTLVHITTRGKGTRTSQMAKTAEQLSNNSAVPGLGN